LGPLGLAGHLAGRDLRQRRQAEENTEDDSEKAKNCPHIPIRSKKR
jgi:hypothetical protein